MNIFSVVFLVHCVLLPNKPSICLVSMQRRNTAWGEARRFFANNDDAAQAWVKRHVVPSNAIKIEANWSYDDNYTIDLIVEAPEKKTLQNFASDLGKAFVEKYGKK